MGKRWLVFIPCQHAGVTQLVECNLAKVDVASSSLVTRSIPLLFKEMAWKVRPKKRPTNNKTNNKFAEVRGCFGVFMDNLEHRVNAGSIVQVHPEVELHHLFAKPAVEDFGKHAVG